MVVVLSTEIKHSILQLCWLCLWKIVWTTASGEPCRRCAICCCRKSAPGALLFPSLLGSRMSVVSVNINTVFWVMRHVSVFSREMAALHLDFVVSSLLWDRGSMILKFGNRVDSSSRHSTGIGVFWPNFIMWTVPPIVQVLAIWLFFLARLVWKYISACLLSRSSLIKIFLSPLFLRFLSIGSCYNSTLVALDCITIWVRSRNCSCLVTWFCYQLIAKPGDKTATVSWPDPYFNNHTLHHVIVGSISIPNTASYNYCTVHFSKIS